MKNKIKQISNPESTGAAGPTFEHKIQAAFMVSMLTGGIVPTFSNCTIHSLRFQAKIAGYNIDDCVLDCKNMDTAEHHKLLLQVKQTMEFSQRSKELQEVITAAWKDYNNPEKFNPSKDHIALVTGPISKIDRETIITLLEWARYSSDHHDFYSKVNTSKFSSTTKQNKLNVLKSHVTNSSCEEITEEQIWKFLKSFFVVSYDFSIENPYIQSLIISNLQSYLKPKFDAGAVWNELLTIAANYNKAAGVIKSDDLPTAIRGKLVNAGIPDYNDPLEKFKHHGKIIIGGLNNQVGETHIDRQPYLLDLISKTNTGDSSFIIVTGNRGSGKSALIKDYYSKIAPLKQIYCLRAEDFNQPHIDQVFNSMGISFLELNQNLSIVEQKILIIESLEKLLEISNPSAFIDMITYLNQHPNENWTIIATTRNYALQQLCTTYLSSSQIEPKIIKVTDFTVAELDLILKDNEVLANLANSPKIKSLLQNPFIANIASKLQKSVVESELNDKNSLKQAIWTNLICNESQRQNGLPQKRKRVFIDIAKRRSAEMLFEVAAEDLDEEAILKLEEDGLVQRNIQSHFVRPSHDVLEDWALESFIDTEYQRNRLNSNSFFDAIGKTPAMRRAFRFWLQDKLESNRSYEMIEWCSGLLAKGESYQEWEDEIIVSILNSQCSASCFDGIKLLKDNGLLLKRFCFLMRLACKIPAFMPGIQQADNNLNTPLEYLFFEPWGECWENLVGFIHGNFKNIDASCYPEIISVLQDYSKLVSIYNKKQPDELREAGLIALSILDKIKEQYSQEPNIELLLNTIIKVSFYLKPEMSELVDNEVLSKPSRNRPSYIKKLVELLLSDMESSTFHVAFPDMTEKIAFNEWFLSDDDLSNTYRMRSSYDIHQYFGMKHCLGPLELSPASGLKGPFATLFKWHPSNAIKLVIKLCNNAAQKFESSHFDPDIAKAKLRFNDGSNKELICNARLWCGYRGVSVLPGVLQSALMALENFLIELVTRKNDALPSVLNYIMKEGDSGLTLAVVASIITGFPDECGEAIWPILRSEEFYGYDFSRHILEFQTFLNWHRMSFHDLYRDLYAGERDKANSYEWRKQSLEYLISTLQLTKRREKVHALIENDFEQYAQKGKNPERWQRLLSRIDLRNPEFVRVEGTEQFYVQSTRELPPELKFKFEEEQTALENDSIFTKLDAWSLSILNNSPSKIETYLSLTEAIADIKKASKLIEESAVDPSSWNYAVNSVIRSFASIFHSSPLDLEREDLDYGIDNLVNIVVSVLESNVEIESLYKDVEESILRALPIALNLSENKNKTIFYQLIVDALLHPEYKINSSIIKGIRETLWEIEPTFSQRCLDGYLAFAAIQTQDNRRVFSISDDASDSEYRSQIEELKKKILTKISITDINAISFDSHSKYYLLNSLKMIPSRFLSTQHLDLFVKCINLAQTDETNAESFDYKDKMNLMKISAGYLKILSNENRSRILNEFACNLNHSFELLDHLLNNSLPQLDQEETVHYFWELWKYITNALEPVIPSFPQNHIYSDQMIKLVRSLLFDIFDHQKQKNREQIATILDCGASEVIGFVGQTACNPVVFECFANLLSHYDQIFTSTNLKILCESIEQAQPATHLLTSNSKFFLENVLRKELVNKQKTNLLQRDMYQSYQILLNALISHGSTCAYFLREHLLNHKIA